MSKLPFTHESGFKGLPSHIFTPRVQIFWEICNELVILGSKKDVKLPIEPQHAESFSPKINESVCWLVASYRRVATLLDCKSFKQNSSLKTLPGFPPRYKSKSMFILQPIQMANVIVPQMLRLIAVAVKKSLVATLAKTLLPWLGNDSKRIDGLPVISKKLSILSSSDPPRVKKRQKMMNSDEKSWKMMKHGGKKWWTMMETDEKWSWVMDNVYLQGQFPLEWDHFPHRCFWMLWEEGKQTQAGLPPSGACSRESRSSLPDRGTEKPKGNPRIQRCLEGSQGMYGTYVMFRSPCQAK